MTSAPPLVVLDTNVVVAAAFHPDAASGRIVAAVRDGRLRMAWTAATRREIERIVRRIPLLHAFDVAALFREADELTAPTHPERFTDVADPDDRKFAALALAVGATLVTSDDHLLAIAARSDLVIVSPGRFSVGPA